MTVGVGLALHQVRPSRQERPLAARLADHIFVFTTALLHPHPGRAQRVGLTLCATIFRQEAVGGAGADTVLGACAGQFLNQARGTWWPTAMALLNAVFAACEGAFWTGAAFPHKQQGAVQ